MNLAEDYAEQLRSIFNYSGYADMQRRQFEALSEANQIMIEGAQAIFRRQAEIAQENTQNMIEASRELLSSSTPEAGLQKQAEFAKHLFENGVDNVREMSEVMTKSGFEAFDVLNKCTSANISDLQKAPKGNKR